MLPTAITGTRQVEDYRQSIQHAGGEARIVDPSMPVAEALEGVGGLLLTGGEDVAPELYGEAPHPTVHVNRARDDFEIALIGEARRRDLPILGICRGIQVLNVAGGGTLVQDIPSQAAGALDHNLVPPAHQAFDLAHEIWIDRDALERTFRHGSWVDVMSAWRVVQLARWQQQVARQPREMAGV